jgi:hypothetical protein
VCRLCSQRDRPDPILGRDSHFCNTQAAFKRSAVRPTAKDWHRCVQRGGWHPGYMRQVRALFTQLKSSQVRTVNHRPGPGESQLPGLRRAKPELTGEKRRIRRVFRSQCFVRGEVPPETRGLFDAATLINRGGLNTPQRAGMVQAMPRDEWRSANHRAKYGHAGAPNVPKGPHVIEGVRCPKCNSPMVVRKNRFTHDNFFGCSDYPHCDGTRSADCGKTPKKKKRKKKRRRP